MSLRYLSAVVSIGGPTKGLPATRCAQVVLWSSWAGPVWADKPVVACCLGPHLESTGHERPAHLGRGLPGSIGPRSPGSIHRGPSGLGLVRSCPWT